MHNGAMWVVIFTNGGRESAVINDLDRYGIEAFTPLIKTVKYHNKNKRAIEKVEPLYQCYIFALLTLDSFQKLRKVKGLRKVLREANGKPYNAKEVVERLRHKVEPTTDAHIMGLREKFQKGNNVEIIFNGNKAVAEVIKGSDFPTLRIKHNGLVFTQVRHILDIDLY